MRLHYVSDSGDWSPRTSCWWEFGWNYETIIASCLVYLEVCNEEVKLFGSFFRLIFHHVTFSHHSLLCHFWTMKQEEPNLRLPLWAPKGKWCVDDHCQHEQRTACAWSICCFLFTSLNPGQEDVKSEPTWVGLVTWRSPLDGSELSICSIEICVSGALWHPKRSKNSMCQQAQCGPKEKASGSAPSLHLSWATFQSEIINHGYSTRSRPSR